MSDGEKPKIIIDDDWKAQAQAEKAKLAEQVGQAAEQTPDEPETADADGSKEA